MAINLDDVEGEVTVQGTKGKTCSQIEINLTFEGQAHIATIHFFNAEVTLFNDGSSVTQKLPGDVVSIRLDDPTKLIPVINRRTGANTGNTRTVELFLRDLMSVWWLAKAEAAAPPAP